MAERIDAAGELERQGLQPGTWQETLAALKARLSPADMERFSRAHKNFVAYRSESTLARFYGTVFELKAQGEINRHRFRRLSGILEDLFEETHPGLSILDVGAGAGFIAAALLRHRAPRSFAAYDPVAAVRDELAAQGIRVFPHPPTPAAGTGFDLILCVDSLGEINADEDGLLSRADGVPAGEFPERLEERYGFAQKLSAWKPFLAPGGRVLLWEPFSFPEAFTALAAGLAENGWKVLIRSRVPGRNYLEIRAD